MFNKENADYPKLIWEDLAYQIDHRKEKRSRRENMPYPRFTKIIINHFLKQHKSLTNLNHNYYHTIKDDGIVSRLKFVRIESEPEPEPAKKKTASRRVVKKKFTLFADDNIISDDPDATLELAIQIEAEEAEAARKVHDTHARIMTESISESAKKKSSGRSSKSVVIQDTPSAPKSKPTTSKTKLKGTGGSNKGTGTIPGVPDESTVVYATSNEQDSEHSDDAEKDEKNGDANDEGDDHVSDKQDDDDEDEKTKSDEDDIYKYKIRVHKDEDEEMNDAEVEGFDKDDEEITDAVKEEVEKTSEAKDDTKKTEFLPSSSSLLVSSGFGDQFLKLSFYSSLVSNVKDSTDANVSSLLDIPIQHETPQIQSPSIQKIPVSVIPETTNLPHIPEIVTETPVTTAVSSPQVMPIFSCVQQTPTPILTPPVTTDAPSVTTAIPESVALLDVELRVA
ncbi:hypothetical protein Tco_0180642 [Tanacetum coccineum]